MTDRDEYKKTNINTNRIEVLKEILLELHHGADPDSVQSRFNQHFKGVSAIEIAMMEQALISQDTGIGFQDVMKLCNVHANLFKEAIDSSGQSQVDLPGHPVRVFKDENLALQAGLNRIDRILKALPDQAQDQGQGLIKGLNHQIDLLGQFEAHYTRKEKLFFPHMERKGHEAPPKVMWAVDDQIRELYQAFKSAVATYLPGQPIDDLSQAFQVFQTEFKEMIFKEEAILINIMLESLTEDEWLQIARESDAYGYAIIGKPQEWIPDRVDFKQEQSEPSEIQVSTEDSRLVAESNYDFKGNQYIQVPGGRLKVDFIPDRPEQDLVQPDFDRKVPIEFTNAGVLSLEQIELIFNHLPVEVTYVNKDHIFQYFNQVESYDKMLFARTPSQIGRKMELCHPPKVWDKVKQLMDDLATGRRDQETMWFKMKDQFIYVTYRALRDSQGNFHGVLETVQDIQAFMDLDQPSKRDLSESNPEDKKDF